MSKAFTRESDDAPELPLAKPASALPPGVKNYFTLGGAAKLRDELQELKSQPNLPAIRQRIQEIEQSLQDAVMVKTPPPPWNRVLFGASVRVRDQQNEISTYRIVGVEETDLDRNHISWLSPIAKALLKAHVGERVRLRTPAKEEYLEIIDVHYL